MSTKTLAQNKKAFAIYEILEKIEAGVQLTGGEVKSIRGGKANLKGGFIDVHGEIPWVNNVHISRYKFDTSGIDPLRKRRILLRKGEILNLENKLKTKGITAIPLELYDKNHLIKLLIGLCRGKKMHDRREDLKKRSENLEIKRALKKYGTKG